MTMQEWDMSLACRVLTVINAIVPGCLISIVDRTNAATWVLTFPPGATQQQITDANAALLAFNETARRAAEVLRQSSITGDGSRLDLLIRLRTATAGQIDTWVDANITTIAAARELFKAILKLIALDARRQGG